MRMDIDEEVENGYIKSASDMRTEPGEKMTEAWFMTRYQRSSTSTEHRAQRTQISEKRVAKIEERAAHA